MGGEIRNQEVVGGEMWYDERKFSVGGVAAV